MIPVKHIDPDDLPLYAMHLLPPDETEELHLHLQHSVEARKVLSEIYGDLALFAHTAEMHSPPALARQRLMKHVAREKKAIPFDRQEKQDRETADSYAPRTLSLVEELPARRSTAAKVLSWSGWAIAAGLAVGFFTEHQHTQQLQRTLTSDHAQLALTATSAEVSNLIVETMKDPNAQHVMLLTAESKPLPQGRASYVAEKGSLVFLASNLAPLQSYKTYELWLIPSDGRDPIPAGTFQPDPRGNASVIMPQLPKGVPAKAFGVTIEDEGGATSPTKPIILVGLAS